MNIQSSVLFKKTIVIGIFIFAVAGAILFGLTRASGNATLTLAPSSGTYNINTNFAVSVYENSGSESVSTVDVKLTYDQSKLQFVSLSTTGSPFNFCTESSGGGGQISLVCAKIGGSVTGNQFLGQITFKALAGSGSTSVNFRSDSRILKNDGTDTNIWNGNTSGGSYSFSTPPAPTTPSPSPSTPPPPASSGVQPPAATTSSPQSNPTNPPGSSPISSSSPQPSAVNNQNTTPAPSGKPLAQSAQIKQTNQLNSKPSGAILVAGLALVSLALASMGYLGRSKISDMFNKRSINTPYVSSNPSNPTVTAPVNSINERLNNVSSPAAPAPGSSFAPEPKDPSKPTVSED